MDSQQLIIQNALTKLTYQVDAVLLAAQEKSLVMQKFHGVDTRFLEDLCGQAQRRLTATNLAYIICFAAGLDTQTIATIFTVTPATVYSVRYRLRACFKQGTILPFGEDRVTLKHYILWDYLINCVRMVRHSTVREMLVRGLLTMYS